MNLCNALVYNLGSKWIQIAKSVYTSKINQYAIIKIHNRALKLIRMQLYVVNSVGKRGGNEVAPALILKLSFHVSSILLRCQNYSIFIC